MVRSFSYSTYIKDKNNNDNFKKLELLPKLYWKIFDKEQYQLRLNNNLNKFSLTGNNLNDLCEIIIKSILASKDFNLRKNGTTINAETQELSFLKKIQELCK